MSSVARGLILPIIDWTRANGHPCHDLFDGLGFDEAALRGPLRRLGWAEYIELHVRLARIVGGHEQLASLIESLPTPTVDWLLGSLDSPAKLYRMWSQLSPLLWGSMRLEVAEEGTDTLRISVALADTLPDATIWFRACEGFLAGMPRRIGLPRAAVEVVHLGARSAEWRVRTPGMLECTNTSPVNALAYVTDVGADFGAALRELQEARRRLAEPAREMDDRLQSAAADWKLTPAQAQVLRGVVRGLSNKEIAAELGNAEATVEVHVTRLLRKAGATGRTALVSRFWGGLRAG